MRKRRDGESGYTLIELLISVALALSALGILAMLTGTLRDTMITAGERNDLQQRGRVVIDRITAALARAGAGGDRDAALGSLIRFLPPILPGGPSSILIISSSGAALPARLAVELPAGSTSAVLAYAPGCPPPCGFSDAAVMLVFDGHGDFDLFTIVDVTGTVVALQRHAAGTGASYPAGAAVLLATPYAYSLDTSASEVRASDGFAPTFALASGVVDLAFEYFGDALPPVRPLNASDQANCLYDMAGTPLPMPVLPAPVETLAPLPLATLEDGPWCGTGPNPYDADLLRVRAVSVSARLHASNPALRGTDSRWFRVPGTARESRLMIRDLTPRTLITPANLTRAALQ
jgi:type II secretory pathway pseudopilin PulG